MIGAIQTALSGMFAATRRVEASASNIANLNTAGSLDPGKGPAPYSAVTTVQTARTGPDGTGAGVEAVNIPKNPGFVPVYSPDSPFADANGMIGAPNVDLAEEGVNLILAETAYKASASVIRTASEMQDELLKAVDREA